MRVIDTSDWEVRAVAVSADGRFLAAAGSNTLALWAWAGDPLWQAPCPGVRQLAFSPDGFWLAACGDSGLQVWRTDGPLHSYPAGSQARPFAGGVAFAPDGKHLVASRAGEAPRRRRAVVPGHLDRWTVPVWQPAPGYDFWPGFPRLAFSPDGQFVAGINPLVCEFRFAVSGGFHFRLLMQGKGVNAFLSFAPDSRTAVCGWDAELNVIDVAGGKIVRVVRAPEVPFRDAAFAGAGRYVGTADGAGVLRLWDAATWEPDRAFDWSAGPLTCVAFTADGLAGVCGTARGQLVLFDLE